MQRRQSGIDIGDRVGHVVQSRAAPGKELSHRGLRAQRAQELDVTVANVEEHCFHTL